MYCSTGDTPESRDLEPFTGQKTVVLAGSRLCTGGCWTENYFLDLAMETWVAE